MERFANGIRGATVAEPSSCWTPGTSPRLRRSWMTFHWPGQISWTMNISRSVRCCRFASSWPIPKNSNRSEDSNMSMAAIFQTHLVLGYVAWLLCFGTYVWPWLKGMDRFEAQRAIATLHSFRFFGLVFILPGVTGTLPASFTTVAAWGDFATGVLALLALLTVRARPLFWLFTLAFNVVGIGDL